MKIKHMALALVGLTLAAACTDNDYTELNKGNTELALTANVSDIVLEESNHANEALQLSWTSGTNYGTGNRITYTLELAQEGTDFANPYVVKQGAVQDYSWNPSVESLNAIVLDNFYATAGQPLALQARVIADVSGYDGGQQIASTSLNITPYKPVTPTLYLIGSAAPNGWDANNASEMSRTDNGIFTWTGNLTEGEFKFITTLGQFLPSYNAGGDNRLFYRTDDAEPDDKFYIPEAHCYKVDVNLLTMTISFQQVEGVAPAYDTLYFVGNETDWTFWQMSQDPLDPFLFRIGVFFNKGGEFKFGTADGSWENMYKATEANAPYTSSGVEFIKGFDPDNKWNLTDSETNKSYKICLDIRTGAERMLMSLFTPYSEMYLVGDATPNGWDLGNATPMNVDPSNPNIFTWSGHLNEGELKFSADKQDDWNGAWFMADTENKTPTGSVEKVLFINKSDNSCQDQYKDIVVGGVDRKWRIAESGNYTITLNQLLEEVTIAKN